MRGLATPPMRFALLVALMVGLQLTQESEAVRESYKIKPRQMDSLPVALNLLRRFMPGKLTLVERCERYAILLRYQKSLTQFSVAELGISPERANLRLNVDSETLRDLYIGAVNELKTGHLDQSLLDLVECVRTRFGSIDGKARAFLNQNEIKSLTEQYKSSMEAPMEILINDQVTHPELKANDLHPALKQTLSDLYHGDESKLEEHFPNPPEPEDAEPTTTEAPEPEPTPTEAPEPEPATPKPEPKKQAVVVVESKGSNAQASAQASSVDHSASTVQAIAQANSANDAASATSSAGSNQPATAASAHAFASAASNGQAQAEAAAAAIASDASSNEVSGENSDESSDADSGEATNANSDEASDANPDEASDDNSGEKNDGEKVEPAQEETEEELSHEELEFLNDVKSNLAAVFDGLPENAELPDRCLAYSRITNSDEADLKIPNRADQIVREITASMAARPQTPNVGEEEQQFVPEKPVRDSFMVVLDVFKPEDLGEQLYVDVLDCVAVWQEVDPDIKVYMENHIG